jgi:hypothetical protein
MRDEYNDFLNFCYLARLHMAGMRGLDSNVPIYGPFNMSLKEYGLKISILPLSIKDGKATDGRVRIFFQHEESSKMLGAWTSTSPDLGDNLHAMEELTSTLAAITGAKEDNVPDTAQIAAETVDINFNTHIIDGPTITWAVEDAVRTYNTEIGADNFCLLDEDKEGIVSVLNDHTGEECCIRWSFETPNGDEVPRFVVNISTAKSEDKRKIFTFINPTVNQIQSTIRLWMQCSENMFSDLHNLYYEE